MKTKDEQNGLKLNREIKKKLLFLCTVHLCHRIEELELYNEVDEVFNCL